MPELLTRARHAARAGQLVEADEIIEGILRAAPQEADAWLLRSQIALQFQQFERSLESAARAVQLAPADGASWYALGRACKAAGALERAIHCYQKSLEVGPANPDVLTSLGIAMRAAGRAREAIAAYRQALTIAPDHTIAHHNLANALEALGESAQEALFHRSAGRPGLPGGIEAEYQKGCALRAQGKLPDALAVVVAALQIAPRAPALLSLAATLSTELGHGSQALEYYGQILEQDADDILVLSTASRLAANAGLLYRPLAPAGRRNRSYFRLPHAGTLYLCPQTLFKLHPDFDPLLRGILERDPRGYVVLVRGQYAEWEAALRERFAGTLGVLAERVLFIDSVPAADFLELLGLADIMLDPPHFNGMNSSLEAFAVGLPIVTLPTGLQRGRHTRAMYLRMGISDCIAADESGYVELAVKLGTDAAFNTSVRARILERNHVLYEDSRVPREFERFFTAALRNRGVRINPG